MTKNSLVFLISGCTISFLLQSTGAYAQANSSTCVAKYDGPLVLIAEPNGRTMKLERSYKYIDANCTKWEVPARATVDGASIPTFLWSILGGPFEGLYRNASVVHDWYCAIRTKPWREVHRMFYDAMITSGVPAKQAKLLYFGVYYGGPRWDALTVQNSRLMQTQATNSVGDQKIAQAAAATIGRDDPSVEELAALADGVREGRLTAQQFYTSNASMTVGFAMADDPNRILSETSMQTMASDTGVAAMATTAPSMDSAVAASVAPEADFSASAPLSTGSGF